MGASLQAALVRAWQDRGPLSNALLPLSWLYAGVSFVHRSAYQWGIRPSMKLSVPVIVVGNVVAGGAGKTPTVLGIVAHLLRCGHRPGIVSRGYGGSHTQPCAVQHNSSAHHVGDEPLLLRSSGAPVVVGRDRVRAAKLLLQLHPETTHIVCDDGLQHYRLYRDLEICVFDSRGLGNGRLLPAGPLRQRWPRTALAPVGQSEQRCLVLKTGPCALPGFSATRALAGHAQNALGHTLPLHALALQGPLFALAGIAQPDNFFAMLRAAGVPLAGTLALPDHYDFDSYSRNIDGRYSLICTEKDAVKLWQHQPNAWCVKLLQTLPDNFLAAFDSALTTLAQQPN